MGLRKSGIDLIGDVVWGTHISQIYSSKNDFFKFMGPYIKEGLLNNELCVWIYSNNTSLEEIKSILKCHVTNVDDFVHKGQLKIIPYTQWYVKDESFNEIRVNKQWLKLLNHATDNGYDGLRAVADTKWLEKSFYRSFLHYEEIVHKMITELPFIAVCLYDVNRLDLIEFAEIIRNHDYTIMKDKNEFRLIQNIELLVKSEQLVRSKEAYNKLLEYDKMKMEFFSNISHELRTPLNVMLSALQLIEKLKKDADQDNKEIKYLKIVRQNCFRLLRLINNLIDVTKINSEFFNLELKNCNIVEIVESITLSVAEYIKSKGIKLQFDTTTEEKIIACDSDQIERMILNLLSNAVKFTPFGGNIWVNVVDYGNKVIISVKDNGVGIPKNKQKDIFNKFVQVENLFTRHHEGSGMGLPLVKSLVEKHSGKITVKSEPGRGSEFTIILPANTVPNKIYRTKIKSSPTGHNYVERKNIEFWDIYA